MSSPSCSGCGLRAAPCFAPNGYHLIGDLYEIRDICLDLARTFLSQPAYGEALIQQQASVPTVDEKYKSRLGLTLKKARSQSFSLWVVMAFKLFALLYFLAIVSQGWSSPGDYGKNSKVFCSHMTCLTQLKINLHAFRIFLMPVLRS
jgi:hypothetical protein